MARVARIAQLARHWGAQPARLPPIAPLWRASRAKAYSTEAAPSSPNPRWLSDLQARLKRLESLDLAPKRAEEAKTLSQYVQSNWLELLAGREGFLTAREWRGLDRHAVVWGDMDSMVRYELPTNFTTTGIFSSNKMLGHVNNVVYNRYAESARVNFLQSFVATSTPEHRQQWIELMTPRSIGLILRSIKTDYKFPMEYPDYTTVLHKLIVKPNYDSDHILLEAVILSEQYQRPAARCFEDIVVYDYQKAKKSPLKPFMVDELRRTYDLQEESRLKYEDEVQNLIKSVERVEASAA